MPTEAPDWVVAHEERQKWVNRLYYGDNLDVLRRYVKDETIDLRAEVHDTIEHVLHRGRQDGSIRTDVTALDIIVFGALLAQPLPHIPDWKLTARRRAAIHFDGLAGAAATATEQ